MEYVNPCRWVRGRVRAYSLEDGVVDMSTIRRHGECMREDTKGIIRYGSAANIVHWEVVSTMTMLISGFCLPSISRAPSIQAIESMALCQTWYIHCSR